MKNKTIKTFLLYLLTSLACLITANVYADAAPAPTEPVPAPAVLSAGLYTDLLLDYGHAAMTPGSNGFATTISLGYKFAEAWSVEGGYAYFAQPTQATYYFYGALRRRIFIKNNWEFFTKLGPAWVQGSRDPDQPTHGRITLHSGLGTTYWMRNNFGLTVQTGVTLRRDEVPTTFSLGAGVSYFF